MRFEEPSIASSLRSCRGISQEAESSRQLMIVRFDSNRRRGACIGQRALPRAMFWSFMYCRLSDDLRTVLKTPEAFVSVWQRSKLQ